MSSPYEPNLKFIGVNTAMCVVGFLVGKIIKHNCYNLNYGASTIDNQEKKDADNLKKGMLLPLALGSIIFPLTLPITIPAIGATLALHCAVVN